MAANAPQARYVSQASSYAIASKSEIESWPMKEEDRVCLKKLDSIQNQMDIERDVLRYTGLVRVYNMMLEPRNSFIANLNDRISRLNDYCADRCYFTEDYSVASQRKIDEFGKNNVLVRYCDINSPRNENPLEKSGP